METITIWHKTFPLLCQYKKITNTVFTIILEKKQYTLTVVYWSDKTKRLLCIIDAIPHEWLLLENRACAYTWYSFVHRTTLTLHTHRKKESYRSATLEIKRNSSDTVTSPIHGKVVRIAAQQTMFVQQGAPLVTIESMKMENEICAPYNGFIQTLYIQLHDMVEVGQLLVTLSKEELCHEKKNKTNG